MGLIRACATWATWAASALWLGASLAPTPSLAQSPPGERFIVLASTTSTEQSGLFAHLLPAFTAATGIGVRVLALGTGQALDTARRGDADALLVHDRVAEDRFIADGFATQRREVMFNDFVLIGPAADPAGLRGHDIVAAFKKLSTRPGTGFVSRGDNSGTHAAEMRAWQAAGIDPKSPRLPGYQACGCGMGPALNIAASTGQYLLADRSTWLAFKNPADLAVLVEGDKTLRNPYGVLVVNPAKHPHVKAALAQQFADWLISPAGQASIAAYRIGGKPVFFPSAKR